jgi:transposase
LARRGYNRDGEKGLASIVYGTLTDSAGRPIGVQVYPGNTADPATLIDQVVKLREQFGLQRVVIVGDRGMVTKAKIEQLRQYPRLGWITTLRAPMIRELREKGDLQMSLFDTQNLAEISSAEYPGERLIACYNPLVAEQRRRKRTELLQATEDRLRKVSREVSRRTTTPFSEAQIGVKVGKVLNKFKMAKHFQIDIAENTLQWSRKEQQIEAEQQLDGIYIVRTSEVQSLLPAAEAVRQYRNLSRVEWVYRTMKGLEILVRPIRHRNEDRVRAHIFLCTLAYYVEWHMRQALKPLLFDDEELEGLRRGRDPVAKAQSSQSAKAKKQTLRTKDGFVVHDFSSLLQVLATCCHNHCRLKEGGQGTTFSQVTELSALQRQAFELLGVMYPVSHN